MSKKQRYYTPWFPAGVKPVRVGVYLTRIDTGDYGHSHWNGSMWGWQLDHARKFNPVTAGLPGNEGAACQEKTWRGLQFDAYIAAGGEPIH